MALDGSDHRMCCLLAGRRFEVFLRYVSLDHYFSAFVEFMQLYFSDYEYIIIKLYRLLVVALLCFIKTERFHS